MKLIKIQHYNQPDKGSVYVNRQKYSVTLGNNHKEFFGDKKHVSSYFNTTNKYLNEILQELNVFQGEIYSLYRCGWIYFDTAKNLAIEQKINTEFRYLDKNFDLIVPRSKMPNGNYLTWGFLNKIINALLSILNDLLPFFQYKGHTDKSIKINSLIRVLTGLQSSLTNYPESEENLRDKLKKLL
jgi:hypothetical protein